MTHQLSQNDFEDLSAFIDGELDEARATQVQRLIATEDDWRAAYGELLALESAMTNLAAFQAPASPADDLADRIIASVGRAGHKRRASRLVRYLAPVAAVAAAAVLVVVLNFDRGPDGRDLARPDGAAGTVARQPVAASAAEVDQLLKENLDFFQDYDVLANYETLAAIENLERSGRSVN